jgi:ABC-type oligopeptide transport system substrate-binding subunit
MILERSPSYHGRFTGNVERVELCLQSDWKARLARFEADELDVLSLYRIPRPDRDWARQQHADEYVSVPELATMYVGFDVTRPPFSDVRVRRAFALATDRETVANVVLGGYVAPGTGGFVPPGMPGHSAGIGLPFDPEAARWLLAEAGFPGGQGLESLDGLVSGHGVPQTDFLREHWLEHLGVTVNWEVADWSIFLARLQRDPPRVLRNTWAADYPDPDNFLRKGSFLRQTGWQSQAFQDLVEKASGVAGQEERMALYQQADRILVEEAPIIPLAYERPAVLVKPWVTTYPTSPMGIPHWFGREIVIQPH